MELSCKGTITADPWLSSNLQFMLSASQASPRKVTRVRYSELRIFCLYVSLVAPDLLGKALCTPVVSLSEHMASPDALG
jgi:hypothetical protein